MIILAKAYRILISHSKQVIFNTVSLFKWGSPVAKIRRYPEGSHSPIRCIHNARQK